MLYELRLGTTAAGIGYFGCYPLQAASFDESLAYLRSCPLDEFMHKHLLEMIGSLDEGTVRQILDLARDRDPLVEALAYEASLSFSKLSSLQAFFDREQASRLLPYTPLIHIKSSLLEDQKLHYGWIRIFEANLAEHRELPVPEAAGLPLLFAEESLSSAPYGGAHVEEIFRRLTKSVDTTREAMPSEIETARRALERLEEVGLIAGKETEHRSSLSPHAFYRRWKLDVAVRSGRHSYSVTGIQTSYGKGLTPEAARASYSMEMVERASSFASFGPEGVLGYARPYPLVHSTFTQLSEGGRAVLDPNRLRLEVPYGDEPLYWIEATERSDSGTCPKLLPAQTVFLFCNLDEINLFSGLGSTGLASGNSIEQAKVSALLEVIERDCEATVLYEPSRCFRLEADEPSIRSLLSSYEAKGVHIQVQDLTASLGIPCYKCFVVDGRGRIIKGTAAHLDGRKALLSALTETPYASGEAPTQPAPSGHLATMRFEDLPSYSTGSPSRDLEVLETLILANGYRILYVDLTRKDFGIPVVKAIVPGMELLADFDQFSRVSPRLFANYLRAVGRL